MKNKQAVLKNLNETKKQQIKFTVKKLEACKKENTSFTILKTLQNTLDS